MWREIVNFMFQFLKNIGEFASWLTTDIEGLNMPPLAFFGIGGFAVIIGLWVFKLINPLS